ncbi:tetratricopeptide repeat protein [Rhodoferax sp. TBRC 17660]|uniref:Tetratricopeptide repeat protein n=1 Tax=Rhodoferax potami TaxID=3068338 RepID=A0ABU3KNA1_9BURK|nr:tetratricopeptide repeat protein [Rhodoferax sp. TBRC 17660]MDT7518747.1 tetratricopeptide repeat protein [Rhodoferax sp. TBRC 17660]
MSVINQMLRDLDKRSASPLEPAIGAGTSARMVIGGEEAHRRSPRMLLMAGGVGLAVLAAAFWWWSAAPPVSMSSGPVAELPTDSAMAVASAPAAPWAGLKLATELSELPALTVATQVPGGKQTSSVLPPATIAAAPAVPASAPPPAAVTQPPMPTASPAPVASLAAVPPAPPSAKPAQPVADGAVAAQRQQTAVRDVLAQAQSLYNSGSADAAIQLLQDSLAGAERAQPPTPAATQLMLVRELARMELAQGRSAAVLELMTQVEPLLAGQPELWAVRANAAQRLGRHQDAVQFYGVALQSRPAEQRWLLGTAVSLSALGQLVAAADSAERARSLGPVSKEVWAYLRQQGVVLPEKP